MGLKNPANWRPHGLCRRCLCLGGKETLQYEEFKKYFSSTGLCMNASKSELVVFCCGRPKKEVHFGAQTVAKDANLLGVRQG